MRATDPPPIDLGMPGGDTFVPCHIKQLPNDQLIEAARLAVALNPQNAVAVAAADVHALMAVLPPERIAVMNGKRWPSGQVITVGFLEPTPDDLRKRILAHANAWRERGANVSFVLSQTDPMVRITRAGDGYWSYIGTDIMSIPAGQPTLCLQAFSMSTPESEFRRVVRHEIGHSLGSGHEHMRRDIVARLDPARTVRYFEMTQGWSEQMVRQQVLTPLDEASLMGTPADVDSVMCYQLPASITLDGRPIPGGLDIDDSDAVFMAKVYPGLVVPPVVPVPPVSPPPVSPTDPNPDKPPTRPDPTPPTGPAPKPAVAVSVRGYVGLRPSRLPRKLVVYVPDGKGGEAGWQYDGPFTASKDNPGVVMFQGEGKRL